VLAIGLRRDEVCGMCLADIDLIGKCFTVRTTRMEMLGSVFEETSKSRVDKRTVTIDAASVVALAQMNNAWDARTRR
jgi:hypothetical protein